MTLLFPLVSIFSCRPKPGSSPKADAPAKIEVLITHAVVQAQLVRDCLLIWRCINSKPVDGLLVLCHGFYLSERREVLD